MNKTCNCILDPLELCPRCTATDLALKRELIEALKANQNLLSMWHEEAGDCDHLVGHCVCVLISVQEVNKALIARAEKTMVEE